MKIRLRLPQLLVVWMIVPAMIQISQVKGQDYIQSDFRVSDPSDYFYKAPGLSVNSAGDMVVAWETTGIGSIWFKTVLSKGSQLSDQKLVPSPNSTMELRVAHTDSGNFMVMYGGYHSSWSVYGQLYDHNGNEMGDTLELQRNTSEMMVMNYLSLSADQDHNFGAFLTGMDSVMIEKISGNGEFSGKTIVLKPEPPSTYIRRGIMTRSGHIILVWSSGIGAGELRGQRYDPNGIPNGESFLVGEIEQGRNLQDFALDCDTSEKFVVAWSTWDGSNSEIYSQLFSPEGVPVGSLTRISDDQSSFIATNGEMSMDMDVDGNFVIAWPDTRGSDTSFIYMQQVDKTGLKVGGNFRATTVNNVIETGTSLPTQIDPVVNILHDTIYLVWVNANEDVSYRWDIFANIQKWKVPDVTGQDQPESDTQGIKVYPNPSTGKFSLKIESEYSGRFDMEIYGGTGILVRKERRYLKGQEAYFDHSDLPAGLYYLRIRGASFRSTVPLSISK